MTLTELFIDWWMEKNHLKIKETQGLEKYWHYSKSAVLYSNKELITRSGIQSFQNFTAKLPSTDRWMYNDLLLYIGINYPQNKQAGKVVHEHGLKCRIKEMLVFKNKTYNFGHTFPPTLSGFTRNTS